MQISTHLRVIGITIVCVGPLAAAYKDDIRYNELDAKLSDLGLTLPTGASVGVTQVEAPATTGGTNYLPSLSDPEFTGKTITDQTGGGTLSNHATTVGKNLYGINTSIAPGITDIDVFEANDWVNSGWYIGTPPTETNKLQNHSWVTWFQNANSSIRMDYAVIRDGFLPIAGLYNSDFGEQTVPSDIPDTYGSIYNGITVGVSDGTHRYGTTTYDGAGRVKPEIVAPNSFTSYATPYITAAAALLIESAGSNAAAKDQLTLKSILLAGANKTPFASWDQTSTRPIDEVYGAGQLDVYEAYFIQSAGQQPAGSTISERGWNLDSLSSSSSHSYNISVPSGFGLRNLSALMTWNREVSKKGINYTPSLADMSLELSIAGGSSIHLSDSPVDNLEHIWRDSANALGPGDYTLTVSTDDAVEYAIAWRSEFYQNYALWKDAAFTSTPEADRDAGDDPDFDGVINLFEQAFGGDPEVADPEKLPTLQLAEDNAETFLEIRFRRPTYDNGLTYVAETTSSLDSVWSSSASDIGLQSVTPDTGDFVWHTYRRVSPVSEGTQGFLRVNVTESTP